MTTSDREAPKVRIAEVFPRDGLQTLLYEPGLRQPSTDEKVAFIEAVAATGVPEIEIAGFVHPRVIPQLADAEAIAERLVGRDLGGVRLRALVPNFRGAQRAIAAGVPKISCLVAASPTYQRLNSNMSIDENLEDIERSVELAARSGTEVALGMAISFVCPYDGLVPLDSVLRIAERGYQLGIRDIHLSDSIGLAWPALVRERVSAVLHSWPEFQLGLHLHTLAGTALGNAFAGYEAGARGFDGSAGGIGGGIAMPIHTTEMGNVATEDLVYLFESSGVTTGIDLTACAANGRRAMELVGTGGGHVTGFGTMERFLEINREHLAEITSAPPGQSGRPSG
ncbi:MAG: hydroxymethylglutaryl-CoA lyase [Candidatus Dormibacter sp.]|uniref:hydroxymethylglutaryl-CoA lyase n=1 Tax=Candidatus Dormibacter sp. TaxID=2973982 RepID=UPI000DB239D8|nr:MAG: hydroxymethylglutaryl-CoA lyase [Candidatus Dormibacteraeota bacterium]